MGAEEVRDKGDWGEALGAEAETGQMASHHSFEWRRQAGVATGRCLLVALSVAVLDVPGRTGVSALDREETR